VLHGVLPASHRPRLGPRGRGRNYTGGLAGCVAACWWWVTGSRPEAW
jgi:hypothetical protein